MMKVLSMNLFQPPPQKRCDRCASLGIKTYATRHYKNDAFPFGMSVSLCFACAQKLKQATGGDQEKETKELMKYARNNT
jgi:hypothetical protein